MVAVSPTIHARYAEFKPVKIPIFPGHGPLTGEVPLAPPLRDPRALLTRPARQVTSYSPSYRSGTQDWHASAEQARKFGPPPQA